MPSVTISFTFNASYRILTILSIEMYQLGTLLGSTNPALINIVQETLFIQRS